MDKFGWYLTATKYNKFPNICRFGMYSTKKQVSALPFAIAIIELMNVIKNIDLALNVLNE